MTNTLKIVGIIPARYGSTRFPGKPLADIGGMSMIERVYRQAAQAGLLQEIIVATDDARIEKAVRHFGGNVVMTAVSHTSGTDRCMEAISKSGKDWDVVINIQGDEPLIFPEQIDQLATCMKDGKYPIGTLVKKITRPEDLANPNVVKVVLNNKNEAIYFSRAAIPHNRHAASANWLDGTVYFSHVGIYGYQTKVLDAITRLPPGKLELAEALEQLRWIENGYQLITAETRYENIAVDSPADIEQVLRLLNDGAGPKGAVK